MRCLGKSIKFENCNLILKDNNTGATTKVKYAIVKIQYSVSEEIIPLRLFQYIDKDSNEIITDAAVGELNIGELSGNIMIVYKEDKGAKVIYLPDKRKNS